MEKSHQLVVAPPGNSLLAKTGDFFFGNIENVNPQRQGCCTTVVVFFSNYFSTIHRRLGIPPNGGEK